MSHEIAVRIVNNGACSRVQVRGDINWKTSLDVRAALLELFEKRCEKRVIVDLKGAEHIDSMGASILAEGFEAAEKRHMDFILTGLH
jgi:anti-anti-sigma factor